MDYPTKASAAAAAIPSTVITVELSGYYTAGDRGGSTYRRLATAPAPARPWHFQSADGAWWGLDEERVNPRMFGAVIDGAANDTASVQAALDYGRPVAMLPGTYLVSALTVPANSLVEAPSGEAVLKKTNVSGTMVTIAGSNVTLRGLTVNGSHAVATYAAGFIDDHIGIKAEGNVATPLANIIIEGCRIMNCGDAGILAHLINNLTIRNCEVSRCGAIGIIGYSVHDSVIEANRVNDVYPGNTSQGTVPNYNAYGIAVSNYSGERTSQRVRIVGNLVSDVVSWEGIDEHNGEDISILDNRIFRCATGIAAEHHVSSQPLQRVLIQGNMVYGFGASTARDGQTYYSQAGIVANGGGGADVGLSVRIIGNYVHYTGDSRIIGGVAAASSGGIKVQNIRDPLIVGNTVSAAYGTGIFLRDDGSDRILFGLVAANIVDGIIKHGTAQRGIYASGRVLAQVSDNFIEVDSGALGAGQAASPTYATTFVDNRVT